METQELIKMAEQAGLGQLGFKNDFIYFQPGTAGLEKFYALIVEAERNRCFTIVETEALQYAEPTWAYEILNDIRPLGKTSK